MSVVVVVVVEVVFGAVVGVLGIVRFAAGIAVGAVVLDVGGSVVLVVRSIVCLVPFAVAYIAIVPVPQLDPSSCHPPSIFPERWIRNLPARFLHPPPLFRRPLMNKAAIRSGTPNFPPRPMAERDGPRSRTVAPEDRSRNVSKANLRIVAIPLWTRQQKSR